MQKFERGGIDVNVSERLQNMLCERLGICVPPTEIAVESVQLYADDVISHMYDVDAQQLISSYIAYLKMVAGM